MNEQDNRSDTLLSKIKNNPVLSILIVLGTIIIALSTFTDATRNLLGLLSNETRPGINGQWTAHVTYDWPNSEFTETFDFKGEGSELYGTASFLGIKRGILKGNIQEEKFEFTTKTKEVLEGSEPITDIHHYRGSLQGNEIHFTMQTQGGYSGHVPVEFIAERK